MALLYLPGFPNAETAAKRSREIAIASGFGSPNGYWFRWIQLHPHGWALELSPEERHLLTLEEQQSLIAIQQLPVQVQPTPVFRYIEDQWVDCFFKTGELRLSSFAAFAKHPNEAMRDEKEGWNVLCIAGANTTKYLVTSQGNNCLILSTTYAGPWVSPLATQTRACIEILNPIAFASAIARSLNDCTRVIVGACEYVPSRTWTANSSIDTIDDSSLSQEPETVLSEASHLLAYRSMFRKNVKHLPEAEFRFVWELSNPAPKDLIVTCPEAIAYCQRPNKSEYLPNIPKG